MQATNRKGRSEADVKRETQIKIHFSVRPNPKVLRGDRPEMLPGRVRERGTHTVPLREGRTPCREPGEGRTPYRQDHPPEEARDEHRTAAARDEHRTAEHSSGTNTVRREE